MKSLDRYNIRTLILAIRSGDYYMYDYESDDEVEIDEGKEDEATVAQEQVFD